MAMVRKQITLSPMVAEMLRIVANTEGESESGIINDALKDYVRLHCPEVEDEARRKTQKNQEE